MRTLKEIVATDAPATEQELRLTILLLDDFAAVAGHSAKMLQSEKSRSRLSWADRTRVDIVAKVHDARMDMSVGEFVGSPMKPGIGAEERQRRLDAGFAQLVSDMDKILNAGTAEEP